MNNFVDAHQTKKNLFCPNDRINPDVRPTIYCAAIAEGGIKEWQFALDRYKEEKVVTEKETLSKALACTRHSWLLSRYID